MASTVYYGVSTTPGDQQVKKVKMADKDFQLQEGDILSVYFAFKNEIENPTLALYIGDVNEEINQSNASGDTIYNTGRLPVQKGVWTNGEVVNFLYTHNGSITESNDNIYYWEIISKAVATNDTYGTVVLDGEDDGSAASIRKVKTLIQNIGSGELEYTNLTDNGTAVGTLTLMNYDKNGDPDPDKSCSATIYVPSLTKISVFDNDSKYITSQLVDDLNFVGTSKKLRVGTSTTIDLDEDTTHNVIINSQGTIDLIPVSQVRVGTANANKNLKVFGNISATGTISPINASSGSITNLETSTITIDRSIVGQPTADLGNTSVTSLNINGEDLYTYMNGYLTAPMSELGDYVHTQMYDDSYLIIETSKSAATSITAKTFDSKILVGDFSRIIEAGYRRLGVVRWECYKGTTSNPWDVTVYGMFWEGNKLYAKAAALVKDVKNVIFDADVLFVKNTI